MDSRINMKSRIPEFSHDRMILLPKKKWIDDKKLLNSLPGLSKNLSKWNTSILLGPNDFISEQEMDTQWVCVMKTPEERSKVKIFKFYIDLILPKSLKVLSRHFWWRPSCD